MASQGPPSSQSGPSPPGDSTGIDLTTLFLSAIASAVAAYVCSKIWAPGTLFSAAMTPVIVALVKEGLRKPTQVVANVATVAAPSRWARTSASDPGLVPEDDTVGGPPEPAVRPEAPHVVLPPVVASDEHSAVNIYSTRSSRLRWRIAVITGLLGFAVCVVLFTVPELISGHSIGRGSGNSTTIFGGHRSHRSSTTSTTSTSTSTTKTSTTDTTPTTQTDTNPTTSTPETQRQTPSAATPAPSTSAPSSTTPAPSSATPSTTAP
ncbi:MAG TPA: hypothetical protein VI318_08270 [Baekduia sp.]